MTQRARRFTFLIIGACALVAVVAGFFAREPIELAIFLHDVNEATGVALDADSLVPAGDGYEVYGVRASTRGGALVVDAPRAYVVLAEHRVSLSLDRPQIVLDLDRRGSLRRFQPDTTIDLRLRDGALRLVSGGVPEPKLQFESVDGTVEATGPRVRYDMTLALVDGDRRYPISGRTNAHLDGTSSQAWSAPVLPLQPLAGVFESDGDEVRVRGGTLVALEIDDGATVRGSGQLEDASIALGTHTITGIHGSLTLADGGIGSRALAGTLDRVPIQGAGEVHDLPGRYRWLGEGSNDLHDIANVIETIAAEPRLRWVRVEATAPGLAYAQYALGSDHGPLAISLLAIDPAEPTLHFGTALAGDHVVSGGERTSAMGVRTGAVGGVNGDYFDIGRTYQPQGMLIRAGTLVRGPTDRAALAIDKNGHVTFGEFQLNGNVDVAGRRFAVTQLNNWPAGGADVTIVTPDYGKTLAPAAGVTFAALDPVVGAPGRYRVRSVAAATEPIPVAFGLGFGPAATVALHPGQIVRLSYALEPSVKGAECAIGGGPILIRDGEWYDDPHAPAPDERDYRWPVVALARKADDRLLLVAVDGRHPERSVGMTRPEFGDLLLRLGAVDAMALDSGGSVTLVSRAPGDTNATVRNIPSDNSAERWVSDALFVYSSAPAPTIVPPLTAPTPAPEARPSP